MNYRNDNYEEAPAPVQFDQVAQVRIPAPKDIAGANNTASAPNQSQRYTLKYAVDCKRIVREMEAEDMELNKPTVKDKLKAGFVNVMNKGDLDTAKMLQGRYMPRMRVSEPRPSRGRNASVLLPRVVVL